MSGWTEGNEVRAMIRQIVQASSDPDPARVAEEVLAAMPESLRADALRVALPVLVRQMVSSARSMSHRQWFEYKKRPNREAAWRRQVLRTRLALSTDERHWKFLGECSRDDVLAASAIRRDQAASNIAKAERLERLAEKMRVHRSKVVEDLDALLLAECLTDESEQAREVA